MIASTSLSSHIYKIIIRNECKRVKNCLSSQQRNRLVEVVRKENYDTSYFPRRSFSNTFKHPIKQSFCTLGIDTFPRRKKNVFNLQWSHQFAHFSTAPSFTDIPDLVNSTQVDKSYPTVAVNNDGSMILIGFSEEESASSDDDRERLTPEPTNTTTNDRIVSTTTFHAPWLWSNCPNNIHFTGARQRTPGQYKGAKIKSAHIVPASDIAHNESSSIVPIPPPPHDSCHPICHPFFTTQNTGWDTTSKNIHTNNGNENNSGKQIQDEQLLLCVSWDDSTFDSYFDMGWLQRWRYDHEALHRRKQGTVVNPNCALRSGDELERFPYSNFLGDETDNTVFDFLHVSRFQV